MLKIAWNRKYPDYWVCMMCNQQFPNKTGHQRKFCSYACRNLSYKGKHPAGTFQSGSNHWNYNGRPIDRNATRFNYPMMRAIANKCDYTCKLCGFQFSRLPIYKVRREMSFDHTVPVRLGGKHSVENGQLLCRKCNKLKTREDVLKILALSRVSKGTS